MKKEICQLYPLALLRRKSIKVLNNQQKGELRMSDVYDNVWETRKRKPPVREEKKLIEVKPPSTDRDRLNDTIERRKKNVYGMK